MKEEALDGMLKRYTSLVNSGDAGFWDPEEETPVKNGRAALSVHPQAALEMKLREARAGAFEEAEKMISDGETIWNARYKLKQKAAKLRAQEGGQP